MGTRKRKSLPVAVRREAMTRDERTCQRCGRYHEVELHLHHVLPHSQGGPDTAENLVTLCEFCHREWEAVASDLADLTFDEWRRLPPARWLLGIVRCPELVPESLNARQFVQALRDPAFKLSIQALALLED